MTSEGRRRGSRNSRLEIECRPKKQTSCKRKGLTRSNTHAVPRLVHTLHDGQRSHSSSRVRSEDLSRRPTAAMDYYFHKPNSIASPQTIPDESVTCIAVKERQTPEHCEQRSSEEGIEEPWASEPVARFINSLGYKEITVKSDRNLAIIAFRSRLAEDCKAEVLTEDAVKRDEPSNGLVENAVMLLRGVIRTNQEPYGELHTRRTQGRLPDLAVVGGTCGEHFVQVPEGSRWSDAI